MKKDLEIYNSWMVKTPIAHRGLHDNVSPENTLGAFQKAIDKGYAIEMDVQMSKDGVLMVFHDHNMKRCTGQDNFIENYTYEEIKAFRVMNTNEKVPTMEEFLELVAGKTPLLIEIKDHSNIGELETKLTAMLRTYKGEFSVQSFNPFIVKWFKVNASEFVRGQLSSDFKDDNLAWYKKLLLKHLFFIKSNGSQFVSYDIKDIKRSQLKRVKKRMPILMWTVHSNKELEDYQESYDNFIFENFIPDKKY